MATSYVTEVDQTGNIQNNVKLEDTAKSSRFTRRQKLTLLSISLANLADYISANRMGASDTIVGLVFGCFALIMFVTSPIFGKLLPRLGAKLLFLSGSFMYGVSVIIFGFLDRAHRGTEFIVFCFIVRSVQAVGAAASTTVAFAIIAQTFPENVSTTLGILEIFSGIAFSIGPPLGGFLYQVGGYSLPFVALGACSVLIVIVNYFVLPKQGEGERPESGSMLQLLSIPSVIVTSFCVLVGTMALGFLNPTLAKHLQQFHLDTTAVGSVFLVISASYTTSAFFWGYLTDKFDIPKLLMVVGNIGVCAAFVYMGPSPLLSSHSQLWIVMLSMVLLGLSTGCALVPIFYDLISTARWKGMPDNLGTYGLVSGLFNSLFSLGNFVGPTVGGALLEAVGFNWAATIFSGLHLFLALFLIVFSLWEYQCGKGRRVLLEQAKTVTSTNPERDERSPLLSV